MYLINKNYLFLFDFYRYNLTAVSKFNVLLCLLTNQFVRYLYLLSTWWALI